MADSVTKIDPNSRTPSTVLARFVRQIDSISLAGDNMLCPTGWFFYRISTAPLNSIGGTITAAAPVGKLT